MSVIMDYECFCERQESEIDKKMAAPKKVMSLFQRKIVDKMLNVKNQKQGMDLKFSGLNMKDGSHS